MFHCTLGSGFKWLEISLTTDDNLSTIYSIASENSGEKYPYYINIKKESFK
jgi:2-keto-3-deoxy-6-phosphogluconate aldolase